MNQPIDGRVFLDLYEDIADEVLEDLYKHGEYHSLHEGYAMLAEEVDELWDWVRAKREKRDPAAIRREAVQIAAVAVKIAYTFGPKKKVPRNEGEMGKRAKDPLITDWTAAEAGKAL